MSHDEHQHTKQTLRKKCPYSELFWSTFFRIRAEYGEISPYLVRKRESADQNNSEFGDFSRSVSTILNICFEYGHET